MTSNQITKGVDIVERIGSMERLTIKAPSGLIHLKDNKESTTNTAIKKLSEYEDSEEQGRLLKLPCAVGDTVYKVHKGIELVYECKVVGVKQEHNTLSIKLHANIYEKTYSIWVDDWFDECQIGRTVFLTQEAAEIALRNIGKDE